MNTNDDFENKRLLEEIDKLDNEPGISTEEGAIKTKNLVVENFIFFAIIIAVVLGVVYLYSSKGNATKLEKVVEVSDEKAKENNFEKETPQIAKEYNIDHDNYEESTNNAKKHFESQKENIIVTKNMLNINKEFVLCLNNKNVESIPNISVYIVFYDGENNIIGIEESMIEVLVGNAERYITFENPPENFEKTEVFVTKKYFSDSIGTLFNNELSYKAREDGQGKLEEIEILNTSDKKIDIIEFSVIYYDSKDELLTVESRYCFDLKKGKSEKVDFYGIWNEETGEDIEYDHYEVKVNYAIEYEK